MKISWNKSNLITLYVSVNQPYTLLGTTITLYIIVNFVLLLFFETKKTRTQIHKNPIALQTMIVKSCANLDITCSYPIYVKCLSLSSSCLVNILASNSSLTTVLAQHILTIVCFTSRLFILCNKTTKTVHFFCVQTSILPSKSNLRFAWHAVNLISE